MKSAALALTIAVLVSIVLDSTNAGENINGYITGKVVCDPCLKTGKPIKSAQIMVICFDKTEAGTYARKGITNEVGVYNIAMKPGIEKDRCEVRLHKNSPWKKCRHNIPSSNMTLVDFSKPVKTHNGKPVYGASAVLGYRKYKSTCQ